MLTVVKARTLFDNTVKYYKIESDTVLSKGMFFIGTTQFGDDVVEISCPKREMLEISEWEGIISEFGVVDNKKARFSCEPILKIPATEEHIQMYQENKNKAQEYISLFKKKITEYQLDMKLINLHFPLKSDKLICSYIADKRVDFREFVKDLGSQLKQRIEMFQIGAREAASLTQDCGICGRQLCCSIGCVAFKKCSPPEKKSNGNTKVSKMLGYCGKSRCCTFFEDDTKRYMNES